MRRVINLIFISLISFPLFIFAAESAKSATTFVENQDYKVISAAATEKTTPGKIQVVEFFSYGCPYCYKFEPELEKWLQKKPKNVEFIRVPVVFERGWDIYAKAFYTAQALGVEPKISKDLFEAIQMRNEHLANQSAMSSFFVARGVDKKDFDSAFNFSPRIDLQIQKGKDIMQAYGVNVIPTIIVDGRYQTDSMLTQGDGAKMIKVLSYLVEKSKK